MKKLLILTMLVAIGGCSKEVREVPYDQLVKRGEVAYEVNSQTAFTGKAVKYWDNGQLKFRFSYKDGEPEGLMEFYYKNGQLESKGNWKDGEPDGPQESYGESGRPYVPIES